MFAWWKKRKRAKILQQPFPDEWRHILVEQVRPYQLLVAEERQQLEQLTQVFLAEKTFEGCQGLEITDEIRVVIAGHACLLLLGLVHDYYGRVSSILVYPSTVQVPPQRQGVFTRGPLIARSELPIVGQAFMNGVVLLVWNQVKRDVSHPRSGHNVVYHEFAHILDMFDGKADGTPVLPTREEYRSWAEVCTRVFFDLKQKTEQGKKTLLSSYGALNEAEFFAVATEYFFERPVQFQQQRPELYGVLKQFYRQDPILRLTN
jgi:Mlc titration factor MtfA (ptsG expression regulator)